MPIGCTISIGRTKTVSGRYFPVFLLACAHFITIGLFITNDHSVPNGRSITYTFGNSKAVGSKKRTLAKIS